MSLKDYCVATDFFKFGHGKFNADLDFPCNCCDYNTEEIKEYPCCYCQHNPAHEPEPF